MIVWVHVYPIFLVGLCELILFLDEMEEWWINIVESERLMENNDKFLHFEVSEYNELCIMMI